MVTLNQKTVDSGKIFSSRTLIQTSRVFIVSLSLFIFAPISEIGAEQPTANKADLSYGRALYSYYQQDYLTALSELLLARQRGGGRGHGDHPLLLQGTISLAFGMVREASGFFEELVNSDGIKDPRNPICLHRCRTSWASIPAGKLNAAWFYLGKIYYRRGERMSAAASFRRIQGPLSLSLQHELVALKVNIALYSGMPAEAEELLAHSINAGPWQPYIYYNLGAAYLKEDNLDRSLMYLNSLIELPAKTQEYSSLKDKAITTAAYGLLGRKSYAEAITYFQQVRVDSPLAGKALLGYGWAQLGLSHYRQALVPWLELSSIRPLGPAGQEALLAVPYALEKLGRHSEAMDSLNRADQVYAAELTQLARFFLDIEQNGVLAALESFGRRQDLESRGMLIPLLIDNRFESYLKNMTDLQSLRERLLYWQKNIALYCTTLGQTESTENFELSLLANSQAPSPRSKGNSSREVCRGIGASIPLDPPLSPIDRVNSSLEGFHGYYSSRENLARLDQALRRPEQRQAQMYSVFMQPTDNTSQLEHLEQLERRLQQQWKALLHSEKRTEAALRSLVVAQLNSQQRRLQYYQQQARLAQVRLLEQAPQ